MAKKDPFEVNHDFGFSFDDDSDHIRVELDSVQEKLAHAKSVLYNIQDMITPLLENLMKDPTKPTLRWPNRAEKIKQFKDKLDRYIEEQVNIL